MATHHDCRSMGFLDGRYPRLSRKAASTPRSLRAFEAFLKQRHGNGNGESGNGFRG